MTTDGGKGLQLTATACSCYLASAGIPLQGTAQTLTGALPMSLFLGGASGTIPVSLAGVTSGGATVYL